MEGSSEKDCSPLWNLYQQIVSDMKNSAPLWEEFISKATKLHSALKSALSAITAFLDAFQKIADAATNARGATKDIGTALTRVCLRHRAIETRMKTFINTLLDTLVTPLCERADEWRRGAARSPARDVKRARADLRRRTAAAGGTRRRRGERREPPAQDVQEKKTQLEELEEKAVKSALIEERSRFCHFVSLLNPVVECEVAMLAEVGHLQEGSEQLLRHTTEPRILPPASLQVISDHKSCSSAWPSSPLSPASRLDSRKSSLTSLCSLASQGSDRGPGSTLSCSTPLSSGSSGTLPAGDSLAGDSLGGDVGGTQSPRLASVSSTECGFRSQHKLHRQMSLYVANGPADQSVSSDVTCGDGALGSTTWPDLHHTAQFERAASALIAGRHTVSAASTRLTPRPSLAAAAFEARETIYSRPPLPTRCSSLERPSVPAKTNANTGQHDLKIGKPSSLPPHLTKEGGQAVYVNMSELVSLASRGERGHDKVCSESSASESSLESSSGYGSQGAFAAEDHAHQHQLHADASEIVTLRRTNSETMAAVRENFSISLGSLEEAVRSLDEACETPAFATISKKPVLPKRRPLSMQASAWPRRGSCSLSVRPPPPVRRGSSVTRRSENNGHHPSSETDNLPPPPAFLLQPEHDTVHVPQNTVAETIKQLTELKHMPASPVGVRRNSAHPGNNFAHPGNNLVHTSNNLAHSGNNLAHSGNNLAHPVNAMPLPGLANLSHQHSPPSTNLSTFTNKTFGSNVSLNSAGSLNPIYGQTGHRLLQYVEQNAHYARSPVSCDSRDSLCCDTLSSFGERGEGIYGQTVSNSVERSPYASPADVTLNRDVTSSPRRARPNLTERRRETGLIATLSAKLSPSLAPILSPPTLSPRAGRRATAVRTDGAVPSSIQPSFLHKLSATLQHQQQQLGGAKASTVRERINAHTQPDPRVCHNSLMEQIKRGATLRRNKHCNDRSAPKIR